MSTSHRVVIIGGGIAGMRTGEALRAKGFDGSVVIVSNESTVAYNRPPLSKSALRPDVSAADVPLRGRKGVELDWRLGAAATAIDLDARAVTLDDGSELEYDHVVAATGVRPRRLDLAGPTRGRHTLRTVRDAAALAADLAGNRRLVVLGAGFLGTEVAWTAKQLGCEVTIVAPEPEPLVGSLGAPAAASLRRRHEAAGIVLRTGRFAQHLTGEEAVTGVVLDNAEEIPADVVVEAVGSIPNTEWLARSALDLSLGVRVDDRLRAVGAPQLIAVGDVAYAPQRLLGGRSARLEHWTHAGESARHAAAVIMGEGALFAPIPGFWTEQCGVRLDGYGFPGSATEQTLIAGDWQGNFLARCERDGDLVGLLSIGFVKESAPLIRELAARALPMPDTVLG